MNYIIKTFIGIIVILFEIQTIQPVIAQIRVSYPSGIGSLTDVDITCLLNAGIPTTDADTIEKRQKLLALAEAKFSIKQVIKNLEGYTTDVIIWLTNYKGNVACDAVGWYNANVFNTLSRFAYVWGTNLAAWYVLANKAAGLGDPLCQRLDLISKGKAPNLDSNECPLFQSRSTTKIEDISKSRFRALQSINFFKWLQTFPKGITVKNLGSPNNKGLQNLLYRERPDSLSSDLTNNDARPGYSLRQLGFYSSFLDVERDNGENILDCDVYTIFPLLEYLEVIFYARNLISNRQYTKAMKDILETDVPAWKGWKPFGYQQRIVFLVNFREIAYFCVPSEERPFETLEKNINELCPQNYGSEVIICIQPFIYKDSLTDAPYKASGKDYGKQGFQKGIVQYLME